MKKILIIFVGISLLFLILMGCPPVEDLIGARINLFESDLNYSDRTDLYTHFHPDASMYTQIKDPTYFENGPLATAYIPIHFSNLSEPVDIGGGQKRVTADFSRNGLPDTTCTFVMEESGIDWLIRSFTMDSYSIYKSEQASH